MYFVVIKKVIYANTDSLSSYTDVMSWLCGQIVIFFADFCFFSCGQKIILVRTGCLFYVDGLSQPVFRIVIFCPYMDVLSHKAVGEGSWGDKIQVRLKKMREGAKRNEKRL